MRSDSDNLDEPQRDIPRQERHTSSYVQHADIQRADVREFPDLLCRCSPHILVTALEDMTPMQKKSVINLGFGALFNLKIREIPGKLAYWCMINFEPVTCSLVLPTGTRMHMDDEDVWLTLGIPKGAVPVERQAKITDNRELVAWVNRIGRPKLSIRPSDVLAAMKTDREGGEWFMKNFMILVESCLFENASDGYVKPKILDNLNNFDNIREYNWCGYMLSVLLRTHENWMRNTKGNFSGPILFVIVSIYVFLHEFVNFCFLNYERMC